MKKIQFTYIFLLTLISSFSTYSQDLKDTTIIIEEVIVTGTRVELSRKLMPLNISVLKENELNEYQESAVFPLISRRVPGVFVTEHAVIGFGVGSNTSAGLMTMRGIGGIPNTQVLMMVDGHPQYMGLFGHPLPNSYVSSDLERVEIMRGPGSILYGSNAMGGVVNMITKKQKEDGFSGNARISYGSFNTQKYMANAGYRKKGFHIFTSINRDITDGHRDSSNFEISNAYIKAGYEINSNFEIVADYNIAEFHDVNPGPVGDATVYKSDIKRGKASFSFLNKHIKSKGGIHTYYNFGNHNLSDGWQSLDETYGAMIYQTIKLPYNTQLSVGGDYKRLAGKGNGGMKANQWITNDESSVYALARHRFFNRLSITYGSRLENNQIYGTELVPQAGLSFQAFHNTILKASASKGFRNPTLVQLYLFAPNPDLKPEKLMTYEATISKVYLKNRLTLDLTVFMLEASNLIQNIPNENAPPPMIAANVGEIKNYGLEFEFNYAHNKNWNNYLSYSWLNTEKPILAAPKHQFYCGIDYKWKHFKFAVETNYIGELYTVAGTSHDSDNNKIQNYLMLNSNISYSPFPFIDFFASGKNLLNKEYEIVNGYPMPGIHFMTGLKLRM
jgi:outer membrane cobalamin receptor